MKVLVVGGHYAQNIGDEASLVGLQNLLLSGGLSPQLLILTRPNSEPVPYFRDSRHIPNVEYDTAIAAAGKGFRGFHDVKDIYAIAPTVEAISESDVVAFGNGVLFRDIALGKFRGALPLYVIIAAMAAAALKPVVGFSLTLVEPQTRDGSRLLSMLLSMIKVMSVRDIESKRIAERHGMAPERVHVLPDFAFAVNRSSLHLGTSTSKSSTTYFNFRAPVSHGPRTQYPEDIHIGWASQLVRNCSDLQPAFIASAGYSASRSANDNLINAQIAQKCGLSQPEPLTPHSLLHFAATIDGSAGLITERRHGFIVAAALSTCPTVLIGDAPNNSRLQQNFPGTQIQLPSRSSAEQIRNALVAQGHATWNRAQQLQSELLLGFGEFLKHWD